MMNSDCLRWWKKCWLLFFALVLGSCQQQDRPYANLIFNYSEQKYYKVGSEHPFTGTINESFYLGLGPTKYVATFRDGRRVKKINYYKSGKKALEINDDSLGGYYARWDPDGKKLFETKNHVTRQWYKNGQLKVEVHYNKKDAMDGKTTVWFPNGKVKGVEFYNNGKLDGRRTKWNRSGDKILQEVYADGKLMERKSIK